MMQPFQTAGFADSRGKPGWLAMAIAILLCLGMLSPTHAADKKSREREALRRMQQQLSQVKGQVGTLEQEKAKLLEDLNKVQASSEAVESEAARLQGEVKASKRQQLSVTKELTLLKERLATTEQRLSETQKTLTETTAKLTETTRTLQQTDTEKRNLEAVKVRNEGDLTSCERKNVALYQVGRSLMDRFERKTCGEILAQKDPFTGLKRVETENLLEEYRDKLDEQKWIKPPPN